MNKVGEIISPSDIGLPIIMQGHQSTSDEGQNPSVTFCETFGHHSDQVHEVADWEAEGGAVHPCDKG